MSSPTPISRSSILSVGINPASSTQTITAIDSPLQTSFPFSAFHPLDELLVFLHKQGILDDQGQVKDEFAATPLPSLSLTELSNVERILEQQIHFYVHINNKNASNVKQTLIVCKSVKELLMKLKETSTSMETKVESIEIVGGAVPYILGIHYFRKALGTLAGIPTFPLSEKAGHYLENIPNDIDIRYNVPEAGSSHLSELGRAFSECLAEVHANKENLQEMTDLIKRKGNAFYHWGEILNEDSRYFIIGCDNHKGPHVEFILNLFLKPYLFRMQDLRLDISPAIDLQNIEQSALKIVPKGNLSNGWQALIEKAARILYLDNPEGIEHRWVLLYWSYLTRSFRSLQQDVETILINKLISFTNDQIKKDIAKILSTHHKNNPFAAIALACNLCLSLQSHLPDAKLKEIFLALSFLTPTIKEQQSSLWIDLLELLEQPEMSFTWATSYLQLLCSFHLASVTPSFASAAEIYPTTHRKTAYLHLLCDENSILLPLKPFSMAYCAQQVLELLQEATPSIVKQLHALAERLLPLKISARNEESPLSQLIQSYQSNGSELHRQSLQFFESPHSVGQKIGYHLLAFSSTLCFTKEKLVNLILFLPSYLLDETTPQRRNLLLQSLSASLLKNLPCLHDKVGNLFSRTTAALESPLQTKETVITALIQDLTASTNETLCLAAFRFWNEIRVALPKEEQMKTEAPLFKQLQTIDPSASLRIFETPSHQELFKKKDKVVVFLTLLYHFSYCKTPVLYAFQAAKTADQLSKVLLECSPASICPTDSSLKQRQGFLWLIEKLLEENAPSKALQLMQLIKPLNILPQVECKEKWLLCYAQDLKQYSPTPAQASVVWNKGKAQQIWEGMECPNIEGAFLIHLLDWISVGSTPTLHENEMIARLTLLPLTDPYSNQRIVHIQNWVEKTLLGQSLADAEKTLESRQAKLLIPENKWQTTIRKIHADRYKADTYELEKFIFSVLNQTPPGKNCEEPLEILSETINIFLERISSGQRLRFLCQLRALDILKNAHQTIVAQLGKWNLFSLDKAEADFNSLSKQEIGWYAAVLENLLADPILQEHVNLIAMLTGKFLSTYSQISTLSSALPKSLLMAIEKRYNLLISALLSGSGQDAEKALAIITNLLDDHRIKFCPDLKCMQDILLVSEKLLENHTNNSKRLLDIHSLLHKLSNIASIRKIESNRDLISINQRFVSLLMPYIRQLFEVGNGTLALQWFDESLALLKALHTYENTSCPLLELEILEIGKLCMARLSDHIKNPIRPTFLKALPKPNAKTTPDHRVSFYKTWTQILELLINNNPYHGLLCLTEDSIQALYKNEDEFYMQMVVQSSHNLLQNQPDKSSLLLVINTIQSCMTNKALKSSTANVPALVKSILNSTSSTDESTKSYACEFLEKLPITDDSLETQADQWFSCWNQYLKLRMTFLPFFLEPFLKHLLDAETPVYKLFHKKHVETKTVTFIGTLLHYIFCHLQQMAIPEKKRTILEDAIKIKSIYYDICLYPIKNKDFSKVSSAMVASTLEMRDESINILVIEHLIGELQNASYPELLFYMIRAIVETLHKFRGNHAPQRRFNTNVITLSSFHFCTLCDVFMNKISGHPNLALPTEYTPIFDYLLNQGCSFYDIEHYQGIPTHIYRLTHLMREKQGPDFDPLHAFCLLKNMPATSDLILQIMCVVGADILDRYPNENYNPGSRELEQIKIYIKEFIALLAMQLSTDLQIKATLLLEHPSTCQLLDKIDLELLKKTDLQNTLIRSFNSSSEEVIMTGFHLLAANLDFLGESKDRPVEFLISKLCGFLRRDHSLYWVDEVFMRLLYAISGQRHERVEEPPCWNLSGHVSNQLRILQTSEWDSAAFSKNEFPHIGRICSAAFDPKLSGCWDEVLPLKAALEPKHAHDLQSTLLYILSSMVTLDSETFQTQAYVLIKIGNIMETLFNNSPENKERLVELLHTFWFRPHLNEPVYMATFLTVGTTLYTIAKSQNLFHSHPVLDFEIVLMSQMKIASGNTLDQNAQIGSITRVIRNLADFPSSSASICRAIQILHNVQHIFDEAPNELRVLYQTIIYGSNQFPLYQIEGKSILTLVLETALENPKLRHPGASLEWKEAVYSILWVLYESSIIKHEKLIKDRKETSLIFLKEYALFESFKDVYAQNPPLVYFNLVERISKMIVESLKYEKIQEFAKFARLPLALLSFCTATEEAQLSELRKTKATILANYILMLHNTDTEDGIQHAKEIYTHDVRMKRKGILFKSVKDPIQQAQLTSLYEKTFK
jgi:hypothetical protein